VELKFGDAFGRDEHLLVCWSPVELTMKWRQIARVPISSRSTLGRFREPPAKQRLGIAAIVCAIRSGFGQRSEAAPIQAGGL